jgi:hypothetical protein
MAYQASSPYNGSAYNLGVTGYRTPIASPRTSLRLPDRAWLPLLTQRFAPRMVDESAKKDSGGAAR